MHRSYPSLVASIGLAALILGPAAGRAQPSLGVAQSFAVLGGSTVTNTGSTTIFGDLGVSPGNAVTGFPPGTVAGGTIHAGDAVAAQAQSDVTTAYNTLAGQACNTVLTGQDLGSLTLTPGTYCFASSAQLTGTLTLNSQGNANAVFVFQIGSTLTTASSSSVVVINGGSDCNVFWQVGSSATLGTGTVFTGNILALTSITLNTSTSISGRALARNGAVTLASNSVSICHGAAGCPVITVSPGTLPGGAVGTAYNQAVAASGGVGPYTFAVSAGMLPNGLSLDAATGAITGTPILAGRFNFTITATDNNGCTGSRAYSVLIAPPGCPVITLSPSTLPPAVFLQAYSQTVSASPAGTYTFSVTSGALPPGLSLNGATGAITGTPVQGGIFGFTITATDGASCPGSQDYTLAVSFTSIPTLSGPAMVMLGALLAFAGLAAARRKAMT
ncbi:MAG TPA: ice-binding family protein [Thermoanaerobaculia bacterium]|nr:ice-binding family protein [Thermoanaerobaculia bacterium]